MIKEGRVSLKEKEVIRLMVDSRHDKHMYIFWRNVWKELKLRRVLGKAAYAERRQHAVTSLLKKNKSV